jgi:hypothetical protein
VDALKAQLADTERENETLQLARATMAEHVRTVKKDRKRLQEQNERLLLQGLVQSPPQKPEGENAPPASTLAVVRQLCEVARWASASYASGEWQLVLDNLPERSRAGLAKGLKSVALVTQTMAASLERGKGVQGEDPSSNYGVQR